MSMEIPEQITLQMMRESLYTAVVCDVLDALGYRHQSPRVQLQPYTTRDTLVGRCKTTQCTDIAYDETKPYENELAAVDGCKPDDVLIAAAGGSMRAGIWGELLSTGARNCGCVGAIIDGAIRDVRQMRAMGFPVWARGTCVYDDKNRQCVIEIDVPVEIDGVRFLPGNLVLADEDGVVVVPAEVEDEAVRRAWEKVHAESVSHNAIKAGMKLTEAWEKYGVL